jgi:hypothetical protein
MIAENKNIILHDSVKHTCEKKQIVVNKLNSYDIPETLRSFFASKLKISRNFFFQKNVAKFSSFLFD